MKFTIKYIQDSPTKSGRAKKSATVVDEHGIESKFVTIWPDFLNYTNLSQGMVVEGQLEVTQNGQYTNKTLKPAMNTNGTFAPQPSSSYPKPAYGQQRAYGVGSKVEVEQMKQENIKKNMEWKAEGQAYGNSVTNAVTIVVELLRQGKLLGKEDIEKSIIGYRDFLINESQKYQEKGLTTEEQIEIGEIPF
jgi:hypothetical protein